MRLEEILVRSALIPTKIRVFILQHRGARIGSDSSIAYGAVIKGTRLTIGRGSFVNHGVFVDRGPLTLGDNVDVGPNVSFLTKNHEIGQSDKRAGKHVEQPITVGTGTWIGANVTVLGGVVIGQGCVIAAGSVVTSSTDADALYAGVPAKLVRRFD
ncbi:acyltransferase [Vibrio cholerae]|nr:acyltransferase [Vibrio cholerae]